MKTVSVNRLEMLKKLRIVRVAHEKVLVEHTESVRRELLKLAKETVQRLSEATWSPDTDRDWVGGIGITVRTPTRMDSLPKNMTGSFDAMITYLEVRAGIEIEVPSEVFTQCLELLAVPGGPIALHEEIEKRISDVDKFA